MDTHACPLIHVHLLSHTARIWACGTDILQNQAPKFIHQQGKCTHTLLLELFDDNRHKLMLFTSHCRCMNLGAWFCFTLLDSNLFKKLTMTFVRVSFWTFIFILNRNMGITDAILFIIFISFFKGYGVHNNSHPRV